MQKILVSAAVAAFCATSMAQTTFTTPNGIDSKSGGGNAAVRNFTLGGSFYTNVRSHNLEPNMPTGTATLMQLELRTQTRLNYSNFTGLGRTLARLELSLGYAAKTLSRTFSTNWSGAATKVYSSKTFSLPSYTSGIPTQTWGNTAKLPFSTNFMWDATKGQMLQEWQSDGGKLANGSTFSGTYYLDGSLVVGSSLFVSPSTLSTAASRYVPKSPFTAPACNDSALTSTTSSARAYLAARVYSDTHPTTTLKGKAAISSASTTYTAPGGALITMLSLGGSDAGVSAGALCNKVHVNTSFPLAILAKTAGTSTFSAFTSFTGTGGFATTPFPYNDAWAGQTVYFQAAWDDSVKKAFSLSIATKLTLPKKPVQSIGNPAFYAYDYYSGGTYRGPFGGGTSNFWNSNERWTKK